MVEITLDRVSGEARVRSPDGAAGLNTEFGRMHPDYVGRRARYGFTGIMDGGDAKFGGIAKWDLTPQSGGLSQTVHFGDGCWGGEPIIVPKRQHAGAAAEQGHAETDSSDDVYILTFIHEERTDDAGGITGDQGASFISVVDGTTFEQVCVLGLPRRVPYGLHGLWMSEAELTEHNERRARAASSASDAT